MHITKLSDLFLKNKRVLIRQDLNVPIKNGKIINDRRIKASLPTIKMALAKGAMVMVMSHLGRPRNEKYTKEFSLKPVAIRLSELLGKTVRLEKNWLAGFNITAGELVLCENVRFNAGESNNSNDLSQQIASLCDIFVMDAFGAAHRKHSSTYGVAKYAKTTCAGLLLDAELAALTKAINKPEKPVVAIVGGSKVSTKLTILANLGKIVDVLIVGGGIVNTFIAAHGNGVGNSLYEKKLIPVAQQLAKQCNIIMPEDVVCTKKISNNTTNQIKNITQIDDDDIIVDIGTQSIKNLHNIISNAKTIIWNGPVGIFEIPAFAEGTKNIANAVAQSSAFSVAGGGDTLAAIDEYGIASKISYISSGGGAFLEFLTGKTLPAVDILQKREQKL